MANDAASLQTFASRASNMDPATNTSSNSSQSAVRQPTAVTHTDTGLSRSNAVRRPKSLKRVATASDKHSTFSFETYTDDENKALCEGKSNPTSKRYKKIVRSYDKKWGPVDEERLKDGVSRGLSKLNASIMHVVRRSPEKSAIQVYEGT